MPARILSGKDVAAEVQAEVTARVSMLETQGKSVGLATVLVGDDPASQVYVAGKHRKAKAAGMQSFDHALPSTASQDEVVALVQSLNADDAVDGMIVQLPLPDGLDDEAAVEAIDPAKDADGLHPYNLGLMVLERPGPLPATPQGIMRILEHYGVETTGKLAVVIGRSFLVGRPIAMLLGSRSANATVVQAHSRTKDLPELARTADILVVAAGKAHLVDRSYVKPGATVIDVGIHRNDDGLIGDVDFDDVVDVAGAITPVPGGVGPMTIASLMLNTVVAAERSAGVG